tara:strand:+ start:15762 stop:17522 length:1761 start_codon:yes stop_codon:yes gene_type:complete
MKVFISTSFDNKYTKNSKKKIYATDFDYYKNHFSKNKIIKNDWENPQILQKDFIKLNKVIKKLENIFSIQLSKLHKNTEASIFKKIINVWLIHYVHSYYFKWKIINKLLKQEKKILFTEFDIDSSKVNTIDTKEYLLNLRSSDYHNYIGYFKILKHLKNNGNKNIFFFKKKSKIVFKNKENLPSINKFLFLFLASIDKIFLNFKKIFFLESQNKFFFLRINRIFNQVPFKSNNLFNWNKFKKFEVNDKPNIKTYLQKNIDFKNVRIDEFEKFLIKNFNEEIPTCYTSNFENLKNYIDKIDIKPKIILTFFGHVYNELFKLWIMSKKRKKNLYIIEHGGHHQKIRTIGDYEFEFGKKFVSWVKYDNINTVSLPAINYFKKNHKIEKDKNFLIYVPIQKHKYISRINHGPQSNFQNYSLNDIEIFKKSLSKDIFRNFLFATKQEIDINQKIYLNKLIYKKNILKPFQFRNLLSSCKLVICSYPQTAFVDSLMQKPTILVYRKNLWPNRNDFKNVYNLMKKNKIIFEDAKKASIHVNKIWKDPLTWWMNTEVKSARELFLKKFNLINDEEKVLRNWTTFLRSEINIKNL